MPSNFVLTGTTTVYGQPDRVKTISVAAGPAFIDGEKVEPGGVFEADRAVEVYSGYAHLSVSDPEELGR